MDTKALRQKILDLAIRGKLVPQDPNDEPASVLLERIRAQKKQMVKEGKLKAKDIKNDSVIYKNPEDNLHYEKFADGTIKCIEDEIPFDIPDSWVWTRFGTIFQHNTGKALNSSNQYGNRYKYITTSNVYWEHFELGNLKEMYFSPEELEKCTVTKGDLLVCEGGDIGRANIWDNDYSVCIQNHLHRIRPILIACNQFYYHVFYLYKLIGMINGNGIGLQGLSSNQLHALLIPLPPYNEQIHISKAIDNYIQIINKIAVEKDNINKLIQSIKSKILDLAIQGNLVPQNPNDEPASVLLERIKAEKEELIKQGKIKRDKTESTIFKGDDNSYYCNVDGNVISVVNHVGYSLPIGWSWITLNDIAISITSGKTPNANQLSNDGGVPYFKVSDMNTIGNEIYMKIANTYINSSYDGCIFSKDSLIYPKNGGALLTNKKRILSVDAVVDLNTGVFTPSKHLDMKYIFYLFSTIDFSTLHKGTTIPTIDNKTIGKLIYALPPLEEQRRIVEAIESIFAKIDEITNALT